MTIKVADFGLSRDLFSRDYYRLEDRKTPLPVRWMAPECFEANVFTIYSDVVSLFFMISGKYGHIRVEEI